VGDTWQVARAYLWGGAMHPSDPMVEWLQILFLFIYYYFLILFYFIFIIFCPLVLHSQGLRN